MMITFFVLPSPMQTEKEKGHGRKVEYVKNKMEIFAQIDSNLTLLHSIIKEGELSSEHVFLAFLNTTIFCTAIVFPLRTWRNRSNPVWSYTNFNHLKELN